MEVTRHVQITQNRKLVIFLQYIKKKRDCFCFLLCCTLFFFIFSNDRTTTTEKRINMGKEIITGDGTCTPSTRRSKGQTRQPKDLVPRPPSGKKPASNSFREDTSLNVGLNSRPTSVTHSTMNVKTRPPSGKTRPMSGVKRKSIPSKKGTSDVHF